MGAKRPGGGPPSAAASAPSTLFFSPSSSPVPAGRAQTPRRLGVAARLGSRPWQRCIHLPWSAGRATRPAAAPPAGAAVAGAPRCGAHPVAAGAAPPRGLFPHRPPCAATPLGGAGRGPPRDTARLQSRRAAPRAHPKRPSGAAARAHTWCWTPDAATRRPPPAMDVAGGPVWQRPQGRVPRQGGAGAWRPARACPLALTVARTAHRHVPASWSKSELGCCTPSLASWTSAPTRHTGNGAVWAGPQAGAGAGGRGRGVAAGRGGRARPRGRRPACPRALRP